MKNLFKISVINFGLVSSFFTLNRSQIVSKCRLSSCYKYCPEQLFLKLLENIRLNENNNGVLFKLSCCRIFCTFFNKKFSCKYILENFPKLAEQLFLKTRMTALKGRKK